MRYLSKIGNLLDEFDGPGTGVASGGAAPGDDDDSASNSNSGSGSGANRDAMGGSSNEKETPDGGSSGRGDFGATFGRGFGLLQNAASSASSAAKATAAAGASRWSSLLNDNDNDNENENEEERDFAGEAGEKKKEQKKEQKQQKEEGGDLGGGDWGGDDEGEERRNKKTIDEAMQKEHDGNRIEEQWSGIGNGLNSTGGGDPAGDIARTDPGPDWANGAANSEKEDELQPPPATSAADTKRKEPQMPSSQSQREAEVAGAAEVGAVDTSEGWGSKFSDPMPNSALGASEAPAPPPTHASPAAMNGGGDLQHNLAPPPILEGPAVEKETTTNTAFFRMDTGSDRGMDEDSYEEEQASAAAALQSQDSGAPLERSHERREEPTPAPNGLANNPATHQPTAGTAASAAAGTTAGAAASAAANITVSSVASSSGVADGPSLAAAADPTRAAAGAEVEKRLADVTQQLMRFQERASELENEVNAKGRQVRQLNDQLQESRANAGSLERQVTELKREVATTKKRAQQEAERSQESHISKVREEMEMEMAGIVKQKDEKVRALEEKCRRFESLNRDLGAEVEDLRDQLDKHVDDGESLVAHHESKLETLLKDHRQRVEELEAKLETEERQKHELSLSLRDVEQRARRDLAQLEAERAQADQLVSSLQAQLEEEQQQRAELALSLGEAQQRLNDSTSTGAGDAGSDDYSEAARGAMEEELRLLRETLRATEDKLLDSQSVREMFAKETEMYRTELKIARDERTRLEEDLAKVQEKLRESQNKSGSALDPSQEGALQSVQKEFEARVERYRDELTYLRQKCEEKDRRCEQLLAEKTALAWSQSNRGEAGDLESGIGKLGKPSSSNPLKSSSSSSSTTTVRSLPLALPEWLRSIDEPLRLIVRTLATVPEARVIFFAYSILLHVWVLFILHQSAGTPPH